MPLDQKACQNDSRTADNAQTDINQDVTITYLEARRDALVAAIGELAGEVMTLEETVTAYSNAEDPNTNTDFKKRQEVLEVREKNQDQRIHKVAE